MVKNLRGEWRILKVSNLIGQNFAESTSLNAYLGLVVFVL